mgnify:CR=1 FL=1
MKHTLTTALTFALAIGFTAAAATAQEGASSEATPQRSSAAGVEQAGFAAASQRIERKYEAAREKFNELQDRIADEKLPLTRELNQLEQQLRAKRDEFQDVKRTLDTRTLDLSNLRKEVEARKEEAGYLSNLLSEYVRNFETRVHIAEMQRYEEVLQTAKLAPESTNLTDREIYQRQADLVEASLQRLEGALGGVRFEGAAIAPGGREKPGMFVLVGPYAIFRSNDGEAIGTIQEEVGSLQPHVKSFEQSADVEAVASLVQSGEGRLPFDPTLGSAHKVQQAEDTLLQHVRKGGPVMIPILGLAGLSLIVGLYKWVRIAMVNKPSEKQIKTLVDALGERDRDKAQKRAKSIGGPVGEMLATGVQHMAEPRELIEEVMYEKMLATRLRLQKALPFIAITAASAPLLGLLGTVTGIINTFQMITLFGTGDVKNLSGGISEALITTKFGLIVAVPALLLHALLSRQARGVVDQMEKSGVAVINAIMKTREKKTEKQAA